MGFTLSLRMSEVRMKLASLLAAMVILAILRLSYILILIVNPIST